MSGRRVTMLEPRGKKSRPTSASSTDDLPLLWLPTTAIWGRSSCTSEDSCTSARGVGGGGGACGTIGATVAGYLEKVYMQKEQHAVGQRPRPTWLNTSCSKVVVVGAGE